MAGNLNRFAEVSVEFLDNLLENFIPKKTKMATKYGMKTFNGKSSSIAINFRNL